MKQDIDDKIKSLIGEKEFQNYKNFAFREDMFKLAIGVILGNSFNKIIYGFSDYLIMPLFKFFLSKTGDGWRTWKLSPIVGLDFEIGNLFGSIIDFLLVSIMLYIFYIKIIQNVLRKETKEDAKECNYCCSKINIKAKKCPFCTGDLDGKSGRDRRKNQRAKNNRSK